MNMALAHASRGDADELGLVAQFSKIGGTDIAHGGAQATDELMQHGTHRTLEWHLALDALRHMDGDPWGSLTGWRAWGESHSFFRIAWRDQPIEGSVVPLERRAFRVELPERTFSCSIVSREGEPLRFDFADQIIGATVVRRGRQIDVSIDCDMHTFTVPAPAFAEANERSVTGRLVSPITGVVSVVKCKTGDRVAKGYVLLVIEAMKLEHAVAAGNDGTVAEIYVKAGDHVHEKTELLRFADDPS